MVLHRSGEILTVELMWVSMSVHGDGSMDEGSANNYSLGGADRAALHSEHLSASKSEG